MLEGTARELQIYTGIKQVEVKPESPVLLYRAQCPFAFALSSAEKKDPYTHHHIAFLPPHHSSLNASCFTISMGNGSEKFTTSILTPWEERNPGRCWVSSPAFQSSYFLGNVLNLFWVNPVLELWSCVGLCPCACLKSCTRACQCPSLPVSWLQTSSECKPIFPARDACTAIC